MLRVATAGTVPGEGAVDFAALFAASPNPYVLLDRDLVMVEMNEAYLAATMRRRGDLVGRKMFDAFPSDPASSHGRQLRESFERVLATGRPDQIPLIRYAIPHPDGGMEERFWSATHTPFPDGRGEVRHILQHTVDVTELHRLRLLAERQVDRPMPQVEMGVLRRAEEVQVARAAVSERYRRLLALFDQAPGFMAVLSGPRHVFELANAAYIELVGRRTLIGLPVSEALPEVAEQGFVRLLDRVIETGEPYVGDGVALLLETGGRFEEHYVSFVYQPIIDEDGRVEGVFVQGHDVTLQKTAEVALRAEMRAIDGLNRLAARFAAELDAEALAETVVEAAAEISGARHVLFVHGDGGHPPVVSHRELKPGDRDLFRRLGATEDAAATGAGGYGGSLLSVPVKARDGTVIGRILLAHPQSDRFSERTGRILSGLAAQAAIAFENARLFRSAQREIAQRRQAELELRDLNTYLEREVVERTSELRRHEAALHQAQKMEAIGKLTGGVAHDFNNLLQVIGGNLQLLAPHVDGNQRAERNLQNALSGVARGAKLASHLLAFGRRQSLEPKVINIGRFVRGMDDLLRRAIGEEIELETEVEPDLWNSLADPTQVETALLNLALNARDAMEGRGRLTVSAANVRLDAVAARTYGDLAAGHYVTLAVSDTGHGMSAEVIERAFEPFFTTKPEGKGSGLGLSMVYGFTKQSGGHVAIRSEPGRGTTVTLFLPRSLEPEDVEAEVDTGPLTGGSETILVVEDDEAVRATVVALLQDLGYRVLEAGDAAGGLRIIEAGGAIDLLFTDVVMPGPIRSTELARRARERLPGIEVLFTSGYTENAITKGGRLDPGIELIGKPYSTLALARRLRQLLRRRGTPVERAAATAGGPEESRMEPEMSTSVRNPAAVPAAGRRVLLVEDEPLIRMNAVDMLEDLGCEVSEAGSVREAREILGTRRFDILMADLQLPDGSGLDLAAEARDLDPGMAVVFATGHGSLPEGGERVPGFRLLVKPYDMDALERAIA